MHQKDKIGGGSSDDKKYETWEVKECPQCGRLVKEHYSCEVLSLTAFAKLQQQKSSDVIYEPEDI